jgi:methylmalonyl-CoA epimerase
MFSRRPLTSHPRISIQRQRTHTSANNMSPAVPRPTRIAHVGIAVDQLDAILPFYRNILDLPEVPLDDADGARIAGLAAGDSLVELLQAGSPDSPIGKFVAKRGPGIHHICFAVDDLDRTLARCRTAGVRLIDETPRLGAEGKRIAFIHPTATAGVLIELTEF